MIVSGSNSFFLGDAAVGVGTYSLSNSGSLSATNEIVGNNGTGAFMQSGGTNSAGTELFLGYVAGSGSYSLSGGSLYSSFAEEIGYASSGSFTQSGGTNSATSFLELGNSASAFGSYNPFWSLPPKN